VQSALLFAGDEVEAFEEWPDVADLGRSEIPWIDLDHREPTKAEELSATLGLDDDTRQRLADDGTRPFLADRGSYIHVSALALIRSDGQRGPELVKIDCLVAPAWVVTIHEGRVPVLDEFRERACDGGETGEVDGLELLANMLEWVLSSYLDAFEDVELALEQFDTRAMGGDMDEPESELGHLVVLRNEVGAPRRALTSHRAILMALTRPELATLENDGHAERFGELRTRLEEVIQSARDSRDSVVGSFDVVIARTEQRTNEIMKVLALASVLLLPVALVAGVLGMNVKIGLFTHSELFWVALAVILGIAAATLAAARVRSWI
jgi:magnesium transporter